MRRSAAACLGALALLGVAAMPLAWAGVDPGAATASRMEYLTPAPGSYRLQRIQGVADAELLDANGRPVRLRSLTRGKITLLTFFYTYCVDPLGCPFAHATLTALRDRIVATTALAGRVRFVNVSLDPSHDTPAVVSRYAAEFNSEQPFDWAFVTAPRVSALLPVLEDLGQDVSVEVDAGGTPTRTLHHMLKVFLIDAAGEVREIYSLAYLHPQMMFNDIETLAMERGV